MFVAVSCLWEIAMPKHVYGYGLVPPDDLYVRTYKFVGELPPDARCIPGANVITVVLDPCVDVLVYYWLKVDDSYTNIYPTINMHQLKILDTWEASGGYDMNPFDYLKNVEYK